MSELLDCLNNNKLYVLCSGCDSYIKLAYEKESALPTELLFTSHPVKWMKSEITDLMKSLHANILIMPDGTEYNSDDLSINYSDEDAINSMIFHFAKKNIFLYKKTADSKFLKLFFEQKYIVLAKPSVNKHLKIDVYQYEENGIPILPFFSGSDTYKEYYNSVIDKDVIKEYKPLIMNYKSIKKYINFNDKYALVCNPNSHAIKGKTFTLRLSSELLNQK